MLQLTCSWLEFNLSLIVKFGVKSLTYCVLVIVHALSLAAQRRLHVHVITTHVYNVYPRVHVRKSCKVKFHMHSRKRGRIACFMKGVFSELITRG